jgi:hypothetical protein
MLRAIYDRICQRLEATGLNATEASRLAGLNLDAIRNIRRAAEGGPSGRVGVSTRTLTALAPVLGTTSAWLLEGVVEEAEPFCADFGARLLLVDWAEAALYADPDRPLNSDHRLGEHFGRWPRGYFAIRVPDHAANPLAPAGAYLVVDRHARELTEGLIYLGVLDGSLICRRWLAASDLAEPCASDPLSRVETEISHRHWTPIGRVRRTIIDM